MFTYAQAEKLVLHFLPILADFFKSTAAVLEDSAQMHLLYGWSSFSRKQFNTSEWFQDRLWFCWEHGHHKRTHIKVQISVCSPLPLMTRFALAKCRSFRSFSLLLLSRSRTQPFSQAVSSVAICILLQSPIFSCENINPAYQVQGRTVYSLLQN